MTNLNIQAVLFALMWMFLLKGYISEAIVYSNLWAVQMKGGPSHARKVAEKHGFVYVDEIMMDHYHFSSKLVKRSASVSSTHHNLLSSDPEVIWFEQQAIKKRVKRDLTFTDPKWNSQWYLKNGALPGMIDMNIETVWSNGFTGRGVVVTVLDDGIERKHPDIESNYDPKASKDINGRDDDPTPRYEYSNSNRHGTRCAGEVAAAANNGFCGVGVAYNARIGGIRMLDGDVTDSVEAMSLSFNRDYIDIYSASWGPDDDGKTVDGPGILAKKAFHNGVVLGRNGKGSIFVWASGNGGRHMDNCNCDGYTNSIFTLSISSTSESGRIPWYSEACSSTLATTFSSGSLNERQVITTDLRGSCTENHTGTSASAPLAAGIVALTLQANSNLTWRDMQHIVVLSARPEKLIADDWQLNGAGRWVSHHYGYGLMDAGRMVELAQNWTNVAPQRMCHLFPTQRNIVIGIQERVSLHIQSSGCRGTPQYVTHLEHVQVVISITSAWRGDLQIWLTSPMGTRSTLLAARVNDDSKAGFTDWAFLTTHSWGETSQGEWLLEIENGYRGSRPARLRDWSIIVYGTNDESASVNQGDTGPTVNLPLTELEVFPENLRQQLSRFGIILPITSTGDSTKQQPSSDEDINVTPIATFIANVVQPNLTAATVDANSQIKESRFLDPPYGEAQGADKVLAELRNQTVPIRGFSDESSALAHRLPDASALRASLDPVLQKQASFNSTQINSEPLAASTRLLPSFPYQRNEEKEEGQLEPNHLSTEQSSLNTTGVACRAGLLSYRLTCVAVCPSGWFTYGSTCEPCHVTCAECLAAEVSSCTECFHGSQLIRLMKTTPSDAQASYLANLNAFVGVATGQCSLSGSVVQADRGPALSPTHDGLHTYWVLVLGVVVGIIACVLLCTAIYCSYSCLCRRTLQNKALKQDTLIIELVSSQHPSQNKLMGSYEESSLPSTG